MKKILSLLAIVIATNLSAQNPVNPAIAKYGTAFEVPFGVPIVNTKATYKILVDVVSASENQCWQINENVENIARIINLHVLAGIPMKQLKVVAVFHGSAVMSILNNDAYKEKFGVDNPNLPLLAALKEAGVPLYVCGQTLFKRKVDIKTVAPEVLPTLSAITTVTTFTAKGYTVLKY